MKKVRSKTCHNLAEIMLDIPIEVKGKITTWREELPKFELRLRIHGLVDEILDKETKMEVLN